MKRLTRIMAILMALLLVAAPALAAAKLAFDESVAPYLKELGIAPADSRMEAEVGLMEKATMIGFDAVINQ